MATVNPVFLDSVRPTTGGYRTIPLYGIDTVGEVTRMMWRGIGGPTSTNGGNTTSNLGHLMVTRTGDDAWQTNTPFIVITTTPRQLCATSLANRKGIIVGMAGTASGLVYFGPNNSVNSTTGDANRGLEVKMDQQGYARLVFPLGPRLSLWAVCVSGTSVTITTAEYA